MRHVRGLSFLEVMIVTVLVGTVLIATTSAMASAARAKTELAAGPIEASRLARDIHTIALRLPSGERTTRAASTYADLAVRADLDGAVFSPPINATGAQDATLPDWRQIVRLERHDLADLSNTSDAPAVDAQTWPALDLLTVTLFDRDEEVARYDYWMTP